MKLHPTLLTMLAVLAGPPTTALATPVPTAISAQGVLRSTAGGLQDGLFDMTFSIYASQMGGAALFTEAQTGIVVESGVFSALVGKVTPLDPSIFATNTVLWLGVHVGGDMLELPRFPLTTTPFAFQAQHAESATQADTVASGAVDSNALGMGSVTSQAIANGTIAAADLSSMGCTTGQVLAFNGTQWGCLTPAAQSVYTGGGGVDVLGTVISLAPAGVGNTELKDGAVSSVKILNGSIQKTHLSDMGCTTGQALVRSSNGWVCASWAEGAGISLANSTVSIKDNGVGTLQLADGAVIGTKIALGSIDKTHFGTMGCSPGQILALSAGGWTCVSDQNTTYSNGTGLDLSLGVFSIATGGVGTTELAGLSVTNAKLGPGAVDRSKLGDGAVDGTALANGAVTTAKFGTGVVDTTALGPFSVTTGKLAAGAVDNNALGNLSVTSGKIAAGAVDTTALGPNAVTSAKIAPSAVDTGKIATGAVDTGNLAGTVYAGTGTDFGTASTLARSDHHHSGTCPAGFTSYAGGNGALLCLQAVAAATSSYTADASACFRTHGGHLCSNVELSIACTANTTPFVPPAANYWLGDMVVQGNPGSALATNSAADCNNTKVLATNAITGAGYLCCILQQRY
jgi:hypothetical protein